LHFLLGKTYLYGIRPLSVCDILVINMAIHKTMRTRILAVGVIILALVVGGALVGMMWRLSQETAPSSMPSQVAPPAPMVPRPGGELTEERKQELRQEVNQASERPGGSLSQEDIQRLRSEVSLPQ
jgi:uncharacterized membrane protein